MENTQALVRKLVNVLSILGIVATVVLCFLGYRIGIFTSSDALSGFLLDAGLFAPIVFILLQVVQVVIPVIPGSLGCLAGVLVFGPVWGFIYNYIGIVIGSILNFIFARKYGKTFVKTIIPEKTYEKYIGWLDKQSAFDKWFALAIFIPLAPDDYLCMIAGMTRMTLKKFVTIIVLCKPCSIIAYSFGLTLVSSWIANFIG